MSSCSPPSSTQGTNPAAEPSNRPALVIGIPRTGASRHADDRNSRALPYNCCARGQCCPILSTCGPTDRRRARSNPGHTRRSLLPWAIPLWIHFRSSAGFASVDCTSTRSHPESSGISRRALHGMPIRINDAATGECAARSSPKPVSATRPTAIILRQPDGYAVRLTQDSP